MSGHARWYACIYLVPIAPGQADAYSREREPSPPVIGQTALMVGPVGTGIGSGVATAEEA